MVQYIPVFLKKKLEYTGAVLYFFAPLLLPFLSPHFPAFFTFEATPGCAGLNR